MFGLLSLTNPKIFRTSGTLCSDPRGGSMSVSWPRPLEVRWRDSDGRQRSRRFKTRRPRVSSTGAARARAARTRQPRRRHGARMASTLPHCSRATMALRRRRSDGPRRRSAGFSARRRRVTRAGASSSRSSAARFVTRRRRLRITVALDRASTPVPRGNTWRRTRSTAPAPAAGPRRAAAGADCGGGRAANDLRPRRPVAAERCRQDREQHARDAGRVLNAASRWADRSQPGAAVERLRPRTSSASICACTRSRSISIRAPSLSPAAEVLIGTGMRIPKRSRCASATSSWSRPAAWSRSTAHASARRSARRSPTAFVPSRSAPGSRASWRISSPVARSSTAGAIQSSAVRDAGA